MKKNKFVPQFTTDQLLDIFEGFLDSVEEYQKFGSYEPGLLSEVIRFISLYEYDLRALNYYTYENFGLLDPGVDLSRDHRD